MLDWDNVRVFTELTRSAGLVDAAKKLGIDHSTVSRRMRKFEEQVGTQLFDRNYVGYQLTPEGHRLMEYAETMESTVFAATEELGEHNRLLSGQVRPALPRASAPSCWRPTWRSSAGDTRTSAWT